MQQATTASKVRVVLLRGVLAWGFSTALLITLFNWYSTHQIENWIEISGRFVIYMAMGIPLGLFIWRKREEQAIRKPTRTLNIIRLVFFIALMAASAYALWEMTHR